MIIIATNTLKITYAAGSHWTRGKIDQLCALARSPRVSSNHLRDIQNAVEAKLGQSCELLSAYVDEPLADGGRIVFSTEAHLVIWADFESTTSSLIIRGLDRESRLFWGQIRRSSNDATAAQIEVMVNQLFGRLPFEGLLSGTGYVDWSGEGIRFDVFQRNKTSRHPFLPYWIPEGSDTKVIGSVSRVDKPEPVLVADNTIIFQLPLWLKRK